MRDDRGQTELLRGSDPPQEDEPLLSSPHSQQEDEPLVMFLEPDQLVTDKTRPLPRASLSARANVALWALRVFVLIVSAMVIYTFVSSLGS